MCDHDNREAAMTVTERDDTGRPTVWCDPCIAPLIRALNDGGLATAASCCGHNGRGSDGEQEGAHGWVMLHDGRTLWITNPPTVQREAEVERCPKCRHVPHATLDFCPNMASDNDCACTYRADALTDTAGSGA